MTPRRWTPETVAEALRRKAIELGRQPRSADFGHASAGFPHAATIRVVYGTFELALRAASLDPLTACECGHGPLVHDGFGCSRCGCEWGPPPERDHVGRVAALPLPLCHDYAAGLLMLAQAEALARKVAS